MRSKLRILLSLVALAMQGANAWGAAIYKCKNQQGNLIYQDIPCTQETQTVSSRRVAAEAAQEENAPATVSNGVLIIKQRGSGHFSVDGTINGKPLTFVIDTGASVVVLPRQLAFSAHIYCGNRVMLQTARGPASACSAVIPKLGIGPFQLKDIPAVISGDLGQPLLGMSVLQQFKIEQDQGEMRISPRN